MRPFETVTATVDIALFGRDAELAELGDALAIARTGRGAVVTITGAAGMGKTRLLMESARIAARLTMRTGYGDADPAETVVELAPLLRALAGGEDPILSSEDLSRLRGSAEQRYWLLQDLQAVLESAAAADPLGIFLDDLQWADPGTLQALRELPPRLSGSPIVWVLAARPAPGSLWEMVAEQLGETRVTRLMLEPLATEAVSSLCAETLDAEPDPGVLGLAMSAGGNPFFIVELLRGMREERLIRVSRGRAELVEARLPTRIDAGVRSRLGRLSESARQAALTAASLGRRFTLAQLAAMLGVAPAELLTPVEQLIAADVFIEADDVLGFRHDLIREAVRGSISASARRALDRQAVDVLLAAGAVAAEVAMQLADSAEPGDESAVAVLMGAAESLGTRAPDAAARLSERALELLPTGHQLTGKLVAQTTILLHAAGRPADAGRLAQERLRDVLSASEEAAVCLSLADMFALSPDLRADAGRRALAIGGLSDRERAEHQARLVYNLAQAGRRSEAVELLNEVRGSVLGAGDGPSGSILRLAEAVLTYGVGRFGEALALHEQAMREGFGSTERTRVWVARQWRAELLAVHDRYSDALALLTTGIADAQRERQEFAFEFLDIWRGRALLQTGELADAAAILEGRFEAATGAPVTSALYAAAVVALGRIAIHTGNERRKRAVAGIARSMVASGTPANRSHGAWLLAVLAASDGDVSGARVALDIEGGPAAGELLPLYPLDVTDEAQMVRIALAAGDAELAVSAAAQAAQRAARNPDVVSIQAAAAHARGLQQADTSLLTEATRLYAKSPRRIAYASALEDLGVTSHRSDGTAGTDALDHALALYTALGARWDASRIRGRLRSLGVRRRLVTPKRPSSGIDALSRAERTVAELVAQGMTNKEVAERLFLSPHTVSSHLRHSFTKLGVNSRVELTRTLAAQV